MLLACAVGCGSDPVVDEEPIVHEDAGSPPVKGTCDGVEARLGTGAREYQEVNEGTTVYLFRGPQGGYMLMLSIQAKGMDRDLVTVDYTEHRVDTGQLMGTGQWRVMLPNDLGNGWYERVGIWGEIEPEFWTRPTLVRGHRMTVRVKLTDGKGCVVDGLTWTADIAPDPPPN